MDVSFISRGAEVSKASIFWLNTLKTSRKRPPDGRYSLQKDGGR
jgi:hypothetical protein